jgi:hypothetical protein
MAGVRGALRFQENKVAARTDRCRPVAAMLPSPALFWNFRIFPFRVSGNLTTTLAPAWL